MSYQTKTLREQYSKAYYKTRNYRDYLTRKFDTLAKELTDSCKIAMESSVLDFGCGYGGLLNSLWSLGYKSVEGTDISQWAIEEGHRRFKHLREHLQFYNRNLLRQRHDYIVMLDVMEHMPEYEIENVLKLARSGCVNSLIVRIPVSAVEGDPFVLPVSNNDPTHITCHTKTWWHKQFRQSGFEVAQHLSETTIYDSPGVLAAVYT